MKSNGKEGIKIKSIKFQNGDISITSKRLDIVEDTEQKIQKTKGLLLVAQGELFYNANIGLDRTEVLSIKEKNISKERKLLAISEATYQDENVEKIEFADITTDNKNRKQQINIKLKYKETSDIVDVGGVEVV
ncbi:hypothetical protein [Clostridium brassicae]|uniref:DUF2634 domain-containing protein n=1 Tax=Clostridium brassicae TaxID=2999072 RepID=A0ABT4D8B2_9CLOT|nr:hypothetical protein [Clostridium brassicae]MCY6957903.1 hypothetical protein [Clostridium brassicae]